MSKAAIEDPQECGRPRAGRFSRCVPSMAIALLALILPVAARSLQIQSFHPFFPPSPSKAHAPAVGAPAMARLPIQFARGKGKLEPKERNRITGAMNRRMASRKAPQTKSSSR
jgi:hypothetical protein